MLEEAIEVLIFCFCTFGCKLCKNIYIFLVFIFLLLSMTFIKRFIFICVLLVLAFFVYRLISPTSAKSFVTEIQSFLNATIGTNFSLDDASWSLEYDTSPLSLTGVLVDTWLLLVDDWEDELLLDEVSLDETLASWTIDDFLLVEDKKTQPSTPQSSSQNTPTTKPTTKPTTNTSSSSSSSLEKDIKEFKDLFQNAELK